MTETTEQYRARINQLKTSIENEPLIKKMRDDIAEGISKTGNRQADIEVRQDILEDDFVAVQQDASAASPSGAEVAVARGSYSTLDGRLTAKQNEVTEQLAHIENFEGYDISSGKRFPQAIISFDSDDGKIEDYTIAKGIFDSVGVPLNVAVSTDYVGRNEYMTLAQLKELHSNGWEIMSHLSRHVNLPSVDFLESNALLRDGHNWLKANGFGGNNLAYPSGQFTLRDQKLAKQYYRSSRAITRGHNVLPLESQQLKSYWISTLQNHTDEVGNSVNTFEYYKKAIDDCVANKTYLIISFHSHDIFVAGSYQNLLAQVVEYAASKAPVMTRQDALDNIGNIVDVGIYSKDSLSGDYYVVGANGKTRQSGQLEDDSINFNTPIRELPSGITSVRITTNNKTIGDAPLGKNGTLVTFKASQVGSVGYFFQEYHLLNSTIKYKRFAADNGWGVWKRESLVTLPDNNTFNLLTPIQDFPIGTTYSIINSLNPTFSEAPGGGRGTLVTHKTNDGSNASYAYQEYHTADTDQHFQRSARNDTYWGAWKRDSLVTLADNNTFNLLTPIEDFPTGITYSVINTLNPSFAEAPGGERGTLVTHKTNDGSNASYAYQEYRTVESNLYFQRGAGNDTYWEPWKKFVTE